MESLRYENPPLATNILTKYDTIQWLGPNSNFPTVTCSAPSHYLNQCWLIVNWTPVNKFQWNLNRNSIIFVQENAFENVVCQNGGHFVQGGDALKDGKKKPLVITLIELWGCPIGL